MFEALGFAGVWFGGAVAHHWLGGLTTFSAANLLNNVRRLWVAHRQDLVVTPSPAQVGAKTAQTRVANRSERRGRHGVKARVIRKPALPLLLATAGLGGCASALSPSAFEGGTPRMRPEVFFAGTTRSSGVLENRSGAPTRRLQVHGEGQTLPDGSLQLTQSVTLDGNAPKTRTWVMRRVDEHRYTATLTDASGPVEGEAHGNLFHLSYRMASPAGARMEQWMYLQPDGRTVVNEATVSLLGVVAARLSERITQERGSPVPP